MKKLPYEIQLQIFQNFTMSELNTCSRVSKNWKELSYDENLWRKKFGQTRNQIICRKFGDKLQNCNFENVESQAQKLKISVSEMIELTKEIYQSKINGDFNIIVLYIRQLMTIFKASFTPCLKALNHLGIFNAHVLDKGNTSDYSYVYDDTLSIKIDSDTSSEDIGLGKDIQIAIGNITSIMNKTTGAFFTALKPTSSTVDIQNQVGITFALLAGIIAENKVLQHRLWFENGTIETFIKRISNMNSLDSKESKRIINNLKIYIAMMCKLEDQSQLTPQVKNSF